MIDAYFAGLFDGEGHVRVARIKIENRPRPYTRYQLIAQVQMTCAYTVRELHRTYGGMASRFDKHHIKAPDKNRIQYTWRVWSGGAYEFLKRIQPFSITKREQIDLAISYQEHMKAVMPLFRKHRGNPPEAPEIYAWRDKLCDRMAYLCKHNHDFQNDWLTDPVNNGPTND